MVTKKMSDLIHAVMEQNKFSGSVLIAQGDTVLFNKSYGLASQEFNIPNRPDTRFRICSLTKMVTATAILRLQERELLSVHDTLERYFPGFVRGSEITLHQLLSHTAGILNVGFPVEMIVYPTTVEEIVAFVGKQPLIGEPGVKYEYSNSGYCLFAAIIEQVSGRKYEAFVREAILDPAGMQESFFSDYPYQILKDTASGYCVNESGQLVKGPQLYEVFGAHSSGGLFSTTHDLYSFARALITGKLLSKESLKAMFTRYHDTEECWSNGYGCCVKQIMNTTCVEHFGSYASGFKANISIFPDHELYLVILSNHFSTDVHVLRNALAELALKQEG